MLGTFQHSNLRIELDASATAIADSLTRPAQLQQWLPTRLPAGLPVQFTPGLTYASWLGPVAIQHHVEVVEANGLRLLLSQGIDGFHAWSWGEGWVQSHLEGITLLPLNLGQSLSLLKLRQFLTSQR